MEKKRYSVIYADPPWDQKAGRKLDGYVVENGKQIFNFTDNNSQPLPYSTMTVDEIMNIDIESISKKDAHLYLWVTNKYMPYAFELISRWGYTYSTTLVWAKNMLGGGLGGTFKINTEFLIFARRGSPKVKECIQSTWFNVKRDYVNGYPAHSKKPAYFRNLIERVSYGPYLELFAREQCDGWDVFGNEVNNSIELI